MKKFQIAEIAGEKAHAGTKATEDVTKIAEKMGFEPVYIRMKDTKEGSIHKVNRQIQFFKDWDKAYKQIEENAVVLLQHPFHYPQLIREKILLNLKKNKKVRYICIVHDVEQLRNMGKEKYYEHEFEFMLQIADVLIVHNKVMYDFFVSQGVSEDKLVILGIFDYLRDDYKGVLPSFERCITIAGNLDDRKSGYLKDLNKINCQFYLYGPNFSDEKADNIKYGGILAPDKIPDVLNKGFGLVWDGDSIETCKGGFGDYLRYNNPHKLSLYIASGLPVFIWSQAAESDFVKSNGLGYTVDSLDQIPSILNDLTTEEYNAITASVKKVALDLVGGKYMNKAIVSALRKL